MSYFSGKVKMHAKRMDYSRFVEIVPEIDNNDGSYSLGYIKDGSFVLVKVSPPSVFKREVDGAKILTIPEHWAKELLKSLLKEFGSPEREATEQALDATKNHLEDFRRLVFESRIK